MLTRRDVVVAGAMAALAGSGLVRPLRSAAQAAALEPFVDPLPLPRRLAPIGTYRRPGLPAGALYQVEARQVRQKLHRDLPETTVWGYAGSYPGPTIAALTGQPIYVRHRNGLPGGDHPLWSPDFACVHGPDMSVPPGARRIVAHLHGGKVPQDSDGFPEATILPGETQSPTFVYPNRQEASTLWFHDHALGITRLNVMMGLAAFYILHDPFELLLPLPRGRYDVPLAIQDRSFEENGQLDYPSILEPEFFGEVMLVNGKVWPYLDVDRAKYRLRLLNGCNSRFLRLRFDNGTPFRQIASEQGLLPRPQVMTEITLGPGERADIVVDFGLFQAGTLLTLKNDALSPFPDGEEAIVEDVMQFRVQARTGPVVKLPAILRQLVRAYVDRAVQCDRVEVLTGASASTTRTFFLREFEHETHPCLNTGGFVAVIENETATGTARFWDEIAAEVPLNAVERWVLVNETPDTHPIHLHLVQFQVESRTGSPQPVGNAEGPGIWKDTVQVHPNETVSLLARFEGFRGSFPFHCHILEHEDHEMMRQFRVI